MLSLFAAGSLNLQARASRRFFCYRQRSLSWTNCFRPIRKSVVACARGMTQLSCMRLLEARVGVRAINAKQSKVVSIQQKLELSSRPSCQNMRC